jgi:hypothetical protein
VDVDRIENVHIWPFWSQNDAVGTMLAYTIQNGYGIRTARADGIIITDCFVWGRLYGIYCTHSVNGTTYGSITNCGIEGSQYGIVVDGLNGGNGLEISNVRIGYQSTPSIVNGYGIVMNGTTVGPASVSNCNFWGPNLVNALLINLASGSNVLVNGCGFYNSVAGQGKVKVQQKPSISILGCYFDAISVGGYHVDLNGFTGTVGIILTNNFAKGGMAVNNPGAVPVLVNQNYNIN